MSLWMPEGPCAQVSGHSSFNSLGEPIHSHTSYRCCIYHLSACHHLFLSLQAQTFSWPFYSRANQTSNLTCWKLNMRYPTPPNLLRPQYSLSQEMIPIFLVAQNKNRSLLWSSSSIHNRSIEPISSTCNVDPAFEYFPPSPQSCISYLISCHSIWLESLLPHLSLPRTPPIYFIMVNICGIKLTL